MKFPVLSLFALSLFLLSSCQNTPATATDGSNAAGAAATADPITMSSEPSKLSEQIMTDFLAGRKDSRQYIAIYDSSFNTIKTMKMAWASKDEAGKAKIQQLVEEAMKFRLDYEELMVCTEQLDLLSQQLGRNEISIEDAQKQYAGFRARMLTAQSRLPSEQGNVQNSKQQFDQAFPDGK